MDQRRLSPMYANYEDLRASEVPSPSSTNATHITIMPSAQQQQLEEQQLPGRQDEPQPSGSGSAARAAGVPQYRGFKTCKNPSHPTIRYYIGNYKLGDKIKRRKEREITIAILGISAHLTLDL